MSHYSENNTLQQLRSDLNDLINILDICGNIVYYNGIIIDNPDVVIDVSNYYLQKNTDNIYILSPYINPATNIGILYFQLHNINNTSNQQFQHYVKNDENCQTGPTGNTGPTGPTGAIYTTLDEHTEFSAFTSVTGPGFIYRTNNLSDLVVGNVNFGDPPNGSFWYLPANIGATCSKGNAGFSKLI